MGTMGIPGVSGLPTSQRIELGMELAGVFVLPAGGKTFFVRGDGTNPVYYDDLWNKLTAKDMSGGLYASVASALGQCTAGRGDKIIVLPGHTENLAVATAWTFVDNVEIIGLGWGNTRPTFTFTAAGSTLVLDKKAVRISNCRFLCAGPAGTTALTVTAPFAVSGEGCVLDRNYFEVGIDNDQLCTTFCTVTGANCAMLGNDIIALAQTAAVTAGVVLGSASLGASGFTFSGNFCKVAMAAATTGIISNVASTGSSTNIRIVDNFIQQWKSDSSACISFAGNQATEGAIRRNTFRCMDNASLVAVVQTGTGVDMTLDQNYLVNNVKETGTLTGTVSA